MRELLSPDQMGACDAFTIARGTPGIDLMERAGVAVADQAKTMTKDGGSVLVLAGPGNNGGDGYVAARLLKDQGFAVTVASLGDPEALKNDARWAYEELDRRGPAHRSGLMVTSWISKISSSMPCLAPVSHAGLMVRPPGW
jgi:hydroxyethylthiazole kinase-like uncharacterized protein yjeF